MVKIQTQSSKKYPKGWEIVESFLTDLQNQLMDINNAPAESKRRVIFLFRMKTIGTFTRSTIKDLAISMKCITRRKKYLKNFMTTS